MPPSPYLPHPIILPLSSLSIFPSLSFVNFPSVLSSFPPFYFYFLPSFHPSFPSLLPSPCSYLPPRVYSRKRGCVSKVGKHANKDIKTWIQSVPYSLPDQLLLLA